MQVSLFSTGCCAAACHTMTGLITEPDNGISEVTIPGTRVRYGNTISFYSVLGRFISLQDIVRAQLMPKPIPAMCVSTTIPLSQYCLRGYETSGLSRQPSSAHALSLLSYAENAVLCIYSLTNSPSHAPWLGIPIQDSKINK